LWMELIERHHYLAYRVPVDSVTFCCTSLTL
jgi:dipeptidase